LKQAKSVAGKINIIFSPLGQRSNGIMASLCVWRVLPLGTVRCVPTISPKSKKLKCCLFLPVLLADLRTQTPVVICM